MIAVFIAGMVIGAGLLALALHFNKAKPAKAQARDHVPTAVGLGANSTIGIGSIDADRLRAIFRQIENGTLYEVKRS